MMKETIKKTTITSANLYGKEVSLEGEEKKIYTVHHKCEECKHITNWRKGEDLGFARCKAFPKVKFNPQRGTKLKYPYVIDQKTTISCKKYLENISWLTRIWRSIFNSQTKGKLVVRTEETEIKEEPYFNENSSYLDRLFRKNS